MTSTTTWDESPILQTLRMHPFAVSLGAALLCIGLVFDYLFLRGYTTSPPLPVENAVTLQQVGGGTEVFPRAGPIKLQPPLAIPVTFDEFRDQIGDAVVTVSYWVGWDYGEYGEENPTDNYASDPTKIYYTARKPNSETWLYTLVEIPYECRYYFCTTNFDGKTFRRSVGERDYSSINRTVSFPILITLASVVLLVSTYSGRHKRWF